MSPRDTFFFLISSLSTFGHFTSFPSFIRSLFCSFLTFRSCSRHSRRETKSYAISSSRTGGRERERGISKLSSSRESITDSSFIHQKPKKWKRLQTKVIGRTEKQKSNRPLGAPTPTGRGSRIALDHLRCEEQNSSKN